jgi:uncharacterized membrane protein YeiH
VDLLYILGLVATAAFAASGILAALATRIDLFGAVVVAVVTAVGGGTVRDLILDVPVFWIHDQAWLFVASLTGVLAFSARRQLNAGSNALAYLDAMGVALFGSGALLKCTALGIPLSHGVAMGVVTAIGGGLIRDTLTGRDTLLVSPELYATPIIAGLTLQALLVGLSGLDDSTALLIGAVSIFTFRALAIRWHWRMPDIAINKP